MDSAYFEFHVDCFTVNINKLLSSSKVVFEPSPIISLSAIQIMCAYANLVIYSVKSFTKINENTKGKFVPIKSFRGFVYNWRMTC